jgi:two-component system phosphate regulon sensor histidine kinase PhoR
MASRLNERNLTISQQKQEVEAVLASMSEAVMAVDSDLRILKLNGTMARLFGIDPNHSRGVRVQEVIRNQEFNQFVREALESGDTVNAELTFYAPETKFLQGHGTRLRDSEGKAMGAVVVLNDITRVKLLEDLRKDFVANVSHELRTPITSIKGFVETLLGGAMEDPSTAERFLKIIDKQSERLSNIIEDLLSLSRIEQDHQKIQLAFVDRNLRSALKQALQFCSEHAKPKDIELALKCPADIRFRFHPNLLEQAIINLVDNAIKYSEPKKIVRVVAGRLEDQIRIQVIDQGMGIPRSQLPRLFERFYRVDKARSREMGGTGLGLSIVKHIVLAHGGTIEVESELEHGSTFTLTLPVKRRDMDTAEEPRNSFALT